jgi:hypothetical protein
MGQLRANGVQWMPNPSEEFRSCSGNSECVARDVGREKTRRICQVNDAVARDELRVQSAFEIKSKDASTCIRSKDSASPERGCLVKHASARGNDIDLQRPFSVRSETDGVLKARYTVRNSGVVQEARQCKGKTLDAPEAEDERYEYDALMGHRERI